MDDVLRVAGSRSAPARGRPHFPLARIAAPLCHPLVQDCAEETAWFRHRLADPGVLSRAVGVQVSGNVLLAVPIGSSRRGGNLSVGTMAAAVRAWAALRGKSGFPHVRPVLSIRRDTCHNVAWGPCQPDDDAERGRYFGYTALAIETFLDRHGAAAFSPPPRLALCDTGTVGSAESPTRATEGAAW